MKLGFRQSLLMRTTAVVLAAALFAGLAGLGLAARVARQWESGLQRDNLSGLLDMAAPAASVACYVHDQALAQQVVTNLLAASDVHGASLRAGPEVLAETSRPGPPDLKDRSSAYSRPIKSPFSPETTIGELALFPDPAVGHRQGERVAWLIRASLIGLTLALGLALVLALRGIIILPITAVSNHLHRLGAGGGGLLEIPRGHAEDEIGLLVRDINGLIERLVQHDWQEQARRGPEGAAAARGVFAVRGDGALEAWNAAFLAVLGLQGDPPPGANFPALFGASASRVDVCLDDCRKGGAQATTTFPLTDRERSTQRWVHLTVERIGPDWFQGLLDEVAPPRDSLTWDGKERRKATAPDSGRTS